MDDEWTRRNERLFSGWSDVRVRDMDRRHAPAVEIVLDALHRLPALLGGHQRARVLDAGCGSGSLLLALHDRLPPALRQRVELVGLDLSPPMIARGRNAVAAATPAEGPVPVITFVLGDLVASLPDLGTFDLVTSVESIYYMNDMGAALRGIRSALNDRGSLMILVEEDMVATGDERQDRARLQSLRADIDVDHFHFMPVEGYIDMLSKAGFSLPVVARRDGFISILARPGGGSRI